ncbi:MAG: hypothetical protein AABO57_02465 [Acidobacteriota bacterium]
MTDQGKTFREQALEAISDLVKSRDIEFYMDMALDAIGSKLARNPLFQDLSMDHKAPGISEVLDALVRAEILPEEAALLPDEFEEAIGDLYPFGSTPRERPGELLTTLHKHLQDAIESLAKKHSQAKPPKEKGA